MAVCFRLEICLLVLLVVVSGVENDTTIQLYHYTNKDGADAIKSSGYLRQSESRYGDAFFGDGVYLTSLDPWGNTRTKIALSNWKTTAVIHDGKLDFVFQIKMKANDVEDERSSGRNIYVYRGNLYLKETIEWRLWKWDRETDRITLTSTGSITLLNIMFAIIAIVMMKFI